MKILIAPLHYIADKNEGSEYTRAYNYLEYLSKQSEISGEVLVGYCKHTKLGGFKINSFFNKKPDYISNYTRVRFIFWVFLKWIKLSKITKFDIVWHNGPFALHETFSLIALFNKKTPFIVGPIVTPHKFINNDESRSMGKKYHKHNIIINLLKQIDSALYPISRFLKHLSNATLKHADLVLAKEVEGQKILKKDKITNVIVHNMSLNLNEFKHTNRRHSLPKIKMLSVCYLVKRKSVVDLVELMDYLINIKRLTKYELTIVGNGPEYDNIKDRIKELKLNKYVKLIGFVKKENVHKYYEQSDLFIFTSLSDSMPAVYFEAMASGLPIFTYNSASAQELNDNGVQIIQSSVGDIKLLGDNVINHTKNVYKLKRSGEINYKLSKNKYNFDQNMKIFIKYISELTLQK